MSKKMARQYPLTEQQKGLWFEYELDPENCNYNAYVHYEILGPLNEEKLFHTLHDLTEHFELFKTRFVEKDNQICQEISDRRLPEVIEYIDLSHLENAQEEAKRLLKKKSLSPYDLKKGVSARVHLVKSSNTRYYFSVAFHHIVGDAFSASLFCQYISENYNCSEKYADNRVRKNVNDYLDLIATEVEYNEENKKKNLIYWQNKLCGYTTQFDFGEHSQNVASSEKTEESFELGEEIALKIKDFCKQHRTTPFLFLTGLLAVLLYRYWNQKQIAIGYPTNIRPKSYQNSLGFYITTFPFCIDICPQESFVEHIKKLTDQRREDKKHENITLPEISRFSSRNPSSSEINCNILIISTPFNIDMPLNDLEVNNLSVYGGTPRHDLMLLCDFS